MFSYSFYLTIQLFHVEQYNIVYPWYVQAIIKLRIIITFLLYKWKDYVESLLRQHKDIERNSQVHVDGNSESL